MRKIERWVFSAGTPERLAALRIGLSTVLALRLTRTVYLSIAGQPHSLYRPLSFMKLLHSMPSADVVLPIQVIGGIAAVLAALGWRARFTLPVAWACGLFLGGMTTSLGKVVHNDVLLLLCMVPLLPAPVSDAWSLDARAGRTKPGDALRYGWPVQTALIVVAGSYFFSGFAKLVNSGPAWVFGSSMRWILYISSDSRPTPDHWSLFIADRAWLAHVVAALIVLLELAFPVVLFWKRARPAFVAGAILFHLGTWLTLGLDYWAQAATVAIVLIDWPAILARARRRVNVSRAAAAGRPRTPPPDLQPEPRAAR
jgi:vitamin K-dependent gamma-carboxylase-like protein